jgi:hypothetical protein
LRRPKEKENQCIERDIGEFLEHQVGKISGIKSAKSDAKVRKKNRRGS